MKKFKDIRPEWNDERMDIIGQNGNDGLHYEEVAEAKVPFDPPYNKIKKRTNSDGSKTSGFSIAKQLAKSAMKTVKKEDKYRYDDGPGMDPYRYDDGPGFGDRRKKKTAKKEAYTGGPHDHDWVNKSEKLERARDRAKRMGDHKKHAELDAQIKQHYKRGPGVREGKQLDELDQATIGSYMKKAHNQIGDLNRKAYKKDPDHGDSKHLSKSDQKKLKKRAAGTDRAWTNYVSQHTGVDHNTGKGFGRMRNHRGMERGYEKRGGPVGSLAKKNESVEYDLNEELMFKVKIEGLPAMIMTGKSPADIKAGLRKILKKQDTIKDIPVERLSKAEVKKRYRDLAGEKIDEANDPASKDESSMAIKQLEFIEYAADEMIEHIENGGDFPEWFQNKLSKAHRDMESLHSAMGEHGNDDKEETNESNVYFGTYNKYGDRDKQKGIPRTKANLNKMFADARKKADQRIADMKAKGLYKGPSEEVDKEKRLDTIRRAQMKAQEKRRKAEKRAQKAAMADMDEASSCGSKRKVNELSKDTLGRYIGNATDDKKTWKMTSKWDKSQGGDGKFPSSKVSKRSAGIKKAAFKLAKKR